MQPEISSVAPRLRVLSGPERAAALLFTIARPAAIRLLRQLEPGELRIVTHAATTLGRLTLPDIEDLTEDVRTTLAAGPDIEGSRDEAAALLSGAFTPDQVAGIFAEPSTAAPRSVWDMLPDLADGDILAWLAAQHAQVGAYLLSQLSPDVAARLLGQMPMPARAFAVRRMLACGPVADEIAGLFATVAAEDFAARPATTKESAQPARIASILNQMPPDQSDGILQDLAIQRPEQTALVRKYLFGFDDIVTLTQQARAIVFDKVATDKVVTALRGTQGAVREAVLSALAARARRIVEAELASDDSTPARDIAKARRTIADLVLSLAELGQIELRPVVADAA